MRQGVRNVRDVLKRADSIDRREGLAAYERYHEMMSRLAAEYSYGLRPVVACFVALSPNNDYLGNLRSTVTVLDAHRRGLPISQLPPLSAFNHCARRAYQYLDGVDFLQTAKGLKIRNFYHNILNPTDDYHVTIDGHMLSVWRGQRVRLKAARIAPRLYEEIAGDFREVARKERLLPCQVQAIAWFVWKRLNRIVFRSQLGLFEQDDQWRIVYPVEEVRPYPSRD
jgi:hypothetical protein